MTKNLNTKIPEFKSLQEEAEFWDTHDFTDFLDEAKPVNVHFAKNLTDSMTIRLDPTVLNQIREKAHKIGVGPTTLVRMWVMERLSA